MKYKQFDSYMKNLPAEVLRREFDDTTNAYIMRSIIMNEKKFYRHSENRTLRSMWYSIVKPVLDKLGKLDESDQTEEGLTRWDATLSKYMGQLLRAGMLLYSDLGILDTSRRRKVSDEFYYTVSHKKYGYKGGIAPYPYIIIATEKDTAYNIISRLSSLYGCSCISAKGQNALGAMESLITQIVGAMRYKEWDRTIYIVSMTDYDPAGYYISDALPKQARDILDAVGEYSIDIEYKRVGITPDQLDHDTVYNNMYTPKPANMDKWMIKTDIDDNGGGIDGMRKGLELDALEFDEIREIFVEGIREYVDEDVYRTFIEESYLKKRTLEVAGPLIQKIYNAVHEELATMADVKDFSIHELAMDGEDTIDIDGNVKQEIEDAELRIVIAGYLHDNCETYEEASDLLDE